MKLSQYAREREIGYRAAWNRFKLGKIPGAYQDSSGSIYVPSRVESLGDKAAVYARVSTRKQSDDLERQMARLREFCGARGYEIVCAESEIASGVNDNRPKLKKLLARSGEWGVLVVEHRDRLTRVGFPWFETLLGLQERKIVVMDSSQEETVDLMDDFMSIVYSFAARMYGLRSAKSRAKAAKAAVESFSSGDAL